MYETEHFFVRFSTFFYTQKVQGQGAHIFFKIFQILQKPLLNTPNRDFLYGFQFETPYFMPRIRHYKVAWKRLVSFFIKYQQGKNLFSE